MPAGQNGRHIADDIFKYIFLNEHFCILIRISSKFVPKGLNDNKWASVQVTAWRRSRIQLTDAYMLHEGGVLNEHFCILIRISSKFVPKGPNDNKWALV